METRTVEVERTTKAVVSCFLFLKLHFTTTAEACTLMFETAFYRDCWGTLMFETAFYRDCWGTLCLKLHFTATAEAPYVWNCILPRLLRHPYVWNCILPRLLRHLMFEIAFYRDCWAALISWYVYLCLFNRSYHTLANNQLVTCISPIVIKGVACQCGEGNYLCSGSAKCIPGFLMCDGEADCPQNDDEAMCRK